MAVTAGRDRRKEMRLLEPRLPERTVVYRLFDFTGRLLYVGIAVDISRRLGKHRRDKTWWPQVSYATLSWYADRPLAEDDELRAIRLEAPVFNIQGRGGPLQSRSTPPPREPASVERISLGTGA